MRSTILAAAGWALLSASALEAGEIPDLVDTYASTLEKIRGLLGEACEKAGTSLERLGYTPDDLAMSRDAFRLGRFDAWFDDPLRFKVACDTSCAALRDSVKTPHTVHDILARLLDVPPPYPALTAGSTRPA